MDTQEPFWTYFKGEKSRIHAMDSNHGSSSPWMVAIPTELSRTKMNVYSFENCSLPGYYAGSSGHYFTDVSGQSIGPIFKFKEGFFTPEDRDRAVLVYVGEEA